MITLIHVWKIVILKRGGTVFGSKGQTNWDGQSGICFESAAQPFRCCIDGASFQLSLPTRSAMGAHSWPLVFPWQTAISQSSTSPLCSHRSPYSPPCQNSLSGSSGNVGPLQVSAGVLCGLDTIQTTSACSRKRIRSLLFSNSKY